MEYHWVKELLQHYHNESKHVNCGGWKVISYHIYVTEKNFCFTRIGCLNLVILSVSSSKVVGPMSTFSKLSPSLSSLYFATTSPIWNRSPTSAVSPSPGFTGKPDTRWGFDSWGMIGWRFEKISWVFNKKSRFEYWEWVDWILRDWCHMQKLAFKYLADVWREWFHVLGERTQLMQNHPQRKRG